MPNVDVSTAKIRVTLTDAAGNSATSQSGNFLIDSTAPVINSFQLAGGATSTSGNTISLILNVTDSGATPTGIFNYCFAQTASMIGQICYTSIPTSYSLPFASGSYTIYAKVVDNVGNASAISSYTISLVLGTPPSLDFIAPIAGDTIPSSQDQPITIHWKALQTSASPLNKVSIQYLISGQTVNVDWPATTSYPAGLNLSPTINGSCSLIGVATGCVTLGMPSALAGQKFKIIVKLSDQAGSIAITSSPVLNGPSGLTLFAGADSSTIGGTALSTALPSDMHGLASDAATRDVYILRTNAILKITASTGIISLWAGAAGTGAIVSASFTGVGIYGSGPGTSGTMEFDSQGNLYWISTTGIFKYTKSSNTAALLPGISGYARFRIINDHLYYSLQTNLSCGSGCTYYAFKIYKYNSDGSSTQIAGQDYTQSLNYASEGASALSVLIGPWTLVPLTATTEKIYFINNSYSGYSNRDLYSINADGTVHLEKALIGGASGYQVGISKYLPSRNGFAVWDTNGNTSASIRMHSISDFNSPVIITSYNGNLTNIEDLGNQALLTLCSSSQIISYYNSSNIRSDFAGILPYAGDNALAIYSQIRAPTNVAADDSGNFYFNDSGNNRLRKIDSSGNITSTNWGLTWNATTGANGLSLSTGAPPTMLLSPQFAATYQSNLYGPVGSFPGAVSITGACQYYCTNNSTTNFAATTISSSTARYLAATTTDGLTYLGGGGLFSYDQGNFYHHMYERNSGNFRSYIKKIDSLGNYTQIAGNTSGSWNASLPASLSAGMTLSGNTAGNTSKFRVANGIIYSLQGNILYSGTEGGSWIRQVSSGSINGFVIDKRGSTDPANSIIYFTKTGSTKLFRKTYTSTTGVVGDEIEVVDFSGALLAPVIAEIDPLIQKTYYITDGNSIYKYYNASLP